MQGLKFFGALAVPVLLALTGCRESQPGPGTAQKIPAASVRVLRLETKSLLATEDVVGTVQPKLRATIESKVSGRIDQMLVTPGQSVKAGELLVQIEAKEIQARLDQALATREQSARDAERLRSLLGQKAISIQEFETADSRHRVAVAAVAEAETMLGYTKLTAPFLGVVTRKHVDVGDLASPGRALLEMDDPNTLRLEAGVPEALINRVQLGARFQVRAAAEDAPVTAVLSEIAPSADAGSRTFSVKLDLPANAGLRAGQLARVAIPLGESKALLVPFEAVIQRGQMELIFVVVNQQAQLRLVKTGRRLGGEVELVSGISAGEQVVVEGAAQLREGQPLEVK